MVAQLIRSIESEQFKEDIPQFGAGDTVRVHARVVEGYPRTHSDVRGRRHPPPSRRHQRELHRSPHGLARDRSRADVPDSLAAD